MSEPIAYYNEIDPFAVKWLKSLISRGLIAPGEVDDRSIRDVRPDDLRGFTQCHFFAGIAGWSLALRLSGWGDDRPVWTGSCPCQPFSSAGKRQCQNDDRHLWPEFYRLIRECRPDVVFGEQVASAIGHGWLDGVSADLEGEGYACGAVVLGAHSVGAPHIRQRLFWVAQSENADRRPLGVSTQIERRSVSQAGGRGAAHRLADLQEGRRREVDSLNRRCDEGSRAEGCERLEHGGGIGSVALPERDGRRIDQPECGSQGGDVDRRADSGTESVANSNGQRFSRGPESHGIEEQPGEPASRRGDVGGCSGHCSVGDAIGPRLEGHAGHVDDRHEPGRIDAEPLRSTTATGGATDAWSDFTIVNCRDGKARRVGRGVFPLVNGIPRWLGRGVPWLSRMARTARANRTGRLKGYGNAIVPQVAAELIKAYMEITE